MELAGQIANESIMNIRTVASFTGEQVTEPALCRRPCLPLIHPLFVMSFGSTCRHTCPLFFVPRAHSVRLGRSLCANAALDLNLSLLSCHHSAW